LKKAWKHRLVVFSSNPSLVEKGALFSLYPDNRKLGQSLAQASMAQRRGDPVGVQPTRDLLSVLNTRTAEHLGLGLSRSQLREFDIVFPSR
jgi:putative ABC transport system substrate-binding protein